MAQCPVLTSQHKSDLIKSNSCSVLPQGSAIAEINLTGGNRNGTSPKKHFNFDASHPNDSRRNFIFGLNDAGSSCERMWKQGEGFRRDVRIRGGGAAGDGHFVSRPRRGWQTGIPV
jgi:hypothetical protein